MNPVNKEIYHRAFDALFEEAKKRKSSFKEAQVPKIHIGMATCGIAAGALETKNAFEQLLAERKIEAILHSVGCIGHCYAEPVVIIENPGFPIWLHSLLHSDQMSKPLLT